MQNQQTSSLRKANPFLVLALMTALTACGSKLPQEARELVLGTFDPDERPSLYNIAQVEPLGEDLAIGAEEVWCVNITFRCYTAGYYGRGELSTCADNRLVRLIDGQWQATRLLTDQDRANWEERGCESIEGVIALPSG